MTIAGVPPTGASRGRASRGMVVTIVAAVVGFAVLVGVMAFLFVRQVRQDDPPTRPVTVAARVSPLPDGIEVRATVTAVSGDLPEFTIVAEQTERYYATTGSERAVVNARAALTGITVNGAPIQPGATVRPTGATAELRFVVARRDDGRRVVWVAPELRGLRPVSVSVSADGAPTSCLVPEGAQATQDYFWYRPCGAFPVEARAGMPSAAGYSQIELPATVRIAYDPAR